MGERIRVGLYVLGSAIVILIGQVGRELVTMDASGPLRVENRRSIENQGLGCFGSEADPERTQVGERIGGGLYA